MTNPVPTDQIEQIVGIQRHNSRHFARAVSAEQTVYILHSGMCVRSGRDLRECPMSLALDRGIHERRWSDYEDQAVQVLVRDGELIPWPLSRQDRERLLRPEVTDEDGRSDGVG